MAPVLFKSILVEDMEQLHPAWSFPYGAKSQGISSHVIDHSHWTFQFPHRKKTNYVYMTGSVSCLDLTFMNLTRGLLYRYHMTAMKLNCLLTTRWQHDGHIWDQPWGGGYSTSFFHSVIFSSFYPSALRPKGYCHCLYASVCVSVWGQRRIWSFKTHFWEMGTLSYICWL